MKGQLKTHLCDPRGLRVRMVLRRSGAGNATLATGSCTRNSLNPCAQEFHRIFRSVGLRSEGLRSPRPGAGPWAVFGSWANADEASAPGRYLNMLNKTATTPGQAARADVCSGLRVAPGRWRFRARPFRKLTQPGVLGRELCLAALFAGLAASIPAVHAAALALDGTRFTLDGKPVFLLGFSYYGALGAPEDFIRRDLDDFAALGFNWLRVWATWDAFDHNVSAVDTNGGPREPFLGKLRSLVAECDERGMVVDITLTRSPALLPDLAAHRQAVATLVRALDQHRNWCVDLANEHDVRDARYVPVAELKILREEVRRLDPRRLVTASFGGHDLSREEIREAVVTAGLDFLCPHRPRSPDSPGQTEAQTRSILAAGKELGRPTPVLYQEPFRRGYTDWQPGAADFLADLRGARAGGAAGWCFHNGQQRDAPDHQPRRSFDLRHRRLLDQLDPEEQKVVRQARNAPSATR